MQALATSPSPAVKLGIIAGGGDLPQLIVETCRKQNRPYFVIALEDITNESLLEDVPHERIRIGAIGKAISTLRDEGVEELVLAGTVRRPKISALRPDMKGTKLLARLGSTFFSGGDDSLLSELIRFLEDEGFRIVGAETIVEDILAPEGLIGSIYPDKRAQADIEYGAKIAKQIGKLDIGQAVVVQNQMVLGVEAVEGTDELIARCAKLKQEDKGGVLVKVKKPQQETRIDLPTIGLNTVENVANAGLAGIAVEAGSSLILDRRELARRADQLGIFVLGFSVVE